MPLVHCPFGKVVVVSTNDPHVEYRLAGLFAWSWGSRFVAIFGAGHINASSGLGEWAKSKQLFQELLRAA